MPTVFKNGIVSRNGVNQGVSSSPRAAVPGKPNGSIAASSVNNFLGSAMKVGDGLTGGAITRAKDNIQSFVSDTGFGKALRAVNLLTGANPLSPKFSDANWGSSNDNDWRVKLSMPATFAGSPLLLPLAETNGFVFPYTPQIVIEQSANYNTMQPVHSNYPFFAYQNSQVNAMTIVGDFYIENAKEAEYWVAAVHYLRSVTKMAYGENTANQGTPPPIVQLNGYGDYVFKNVPVAVQMFTVELPNDVDYIKCQIGPNGTWAPTRCTISVVVQPIYSRSTVGKFKLDKFVRGDYLIDEKGFL